ncbi:35229_t:CDS:10, partial [Racocetra persica]
KAVRINAVGSGMELDDLNVILRSKNLEGIVIPKVGSADDVKFVSRMIDLIAPDESRSKIRLLASIESALAIMNIKQIATSDPRLDALIFAAEDYCADVGIVRTRSRKEMLLARQTIVTAASAYELQAIDLVCVDFRNDNILTEECQEGREMGYLGKQAIHPRQIDIIQQMFLPDMQDVERAAHIVYGYEQHSKKGIGAFDLDGKMIDLPMVKWAERILARATTGGIIIPEIKKDEKTVTKKKMSPRTNSPPPSSYGLDDSFEYAEYNPGSSYYPSTPAGGQPSNINSQFYSTQCPVSPHSTPSLNRNNITDATATRAQARARNGSRKTKNNSTGLSSLLPRTLNVPRKILSSSAVQFFTLIVIYSFCITTICFIFSASYFLTLYDDTRRMLRNSRAWAKVKSGVREKISMLGDDWEEFLQNYFDHE